MTWPEVSSFLFITQYVELRSCASVRELAFFRGREKRREAKNRRRSERHRTSTARAPSGPATCRILQERERCRTSRFCVRSRGAQLRLLLFSDGHPLSLICPMSNSACAAKIVPLLPAEPMLRANSYYISIFFLAARSVFLPRDFQGSCARISTDHSFGSRSKRASLFVQRCVWWQAGHTIGSISSIGDASNVWGSIENPV